MRCHGLHKVCYLKLTLWAKNATIFLETSAPRSNMLGDDLKAFCRLQNIDCRKIEISKRNSIGEEEIDGSQRN